MDDFLGQRRSNRQTASVGSFAAANFGRVAQIVIAVVAIVIVASFEEDNWMQSWLGIHMDEFLNFRVECCQSCSCCTSDSKESSLDACDEHCFSFHYQAVVMVNCLLLSKKVDNS